jgi:hypothetical protein
MASLFFTAGPAAKFLPVFFNVGAVVGDSPASNIFEDVLLVQFFFQLIAKQTTNRKLASDARLVGRPDGVVSNGMIRAISSVQEIMQKQNPGQVIDGRVSPATGTGVSYGPGVFTIGVLNNFIKENNFNVWPRIDLIRAADEIPSGIKFLVERTLTGTKSIPDPFATQ